MTTYDIYKLTNLLIPTVGFRQTVAKKEYRDLHPSLLPDTTKSQIYANALSEMFMSVESLSNGLEFDEGFDYDLWDVATNYIIGNRVAKVINGRTYVWVAIANNIGIDPENDSVTNWKTSLSDRLDNYRQSAAHECVSNALVSQMDKAYGKEIIDSTTAYKETSTAIQTQLKGRFVGISIVPLDYKLNKVITIDRIGITLTGAYTDLNVYLYHSSKKEAIQTFIISSADQEIDTYKWYDLIDQAGNPVIIDYLNRDYNQGGIFYLGIFEDDLSNNSQSYKYNELPNVYNQLSNLYTNNVVAFTSIEIQNNKLNGLDLPELGQYYDSVDWNSEIVFNLSFKIEQSFYPQLEKNLPRLQKMYQYTLVFMILKAMMQNDRINKVSDNAQNKIHELLYGDPNNDLDKGLQGKKQQYEKQLIHNMDSVFDDFKGLVQGAI